MQRTAYASLDFVTLSPDRKVPVGTLMANGIAGNAGIFPNPPVKPEELTQLNNQLSDAIAKARTGDKTAAAALLNVEKKWDTAFRSTAKYVGTIANGNEEVIRLGGCTPTKSETSPSQLPATSRNVQVLAERGHGTVSAGCDADTSAKAYLYYARTKDVTVQQDGNSVVFTTSNGDSIVVQADTHRKMIFHNLPSDTRVWVSMQALNNAGSGPLSDEQSVTPQ